MTEELTLEGSMKHVFIALFIAAMGSAMVCVNAWPQAAQTPDPPSETIAPNIPGVVAGGAKVQVVKYGFQGSEGPVAMPDGSLLFTETRANRITRVDNSGSVSTFLENTDQANGLGFDPKGRLIAVQRAPGKMRIGVLYPKGSETVVADTFEGKPFVRPNDILVTTKGGVYFTDAPGIYFIPPGGKVIRVADGFQNPNGIQLSPDEKVLYANNEFGEYLIAFDVQPDGTLRNRRNFARYQSVKPTPDGDNGADGLAIDAEGRVYIATTLGVEVFNNKGEHLGIIPFSRAPQNLAFAGPDKKILYVVGRGAVFKVQMLAQGFRGRAK
jgi:gluconolactonase